MTTVLGTEPDQGLSSSSIQLSYMNTEAEAAGPSSVAFSDALAGNMIRSGAAKTETRVVDGDLPCYATMPATPK